MSRFFKYCIISKAKNIVRYTQDFVIFVIYIEVHYKQPVHARVLSSATEGSTFFFHKPSLKLTRLVGWHSFPVGR